MTHAQGLEPGGDWDPVPRLLEGPLADTGTTELLWAVAFRNTKRGFVIGRHGWIGSWQDRKMTGFEWLWAYFTHTAHHRGQAEVYLRVKGIKPPDYVF